MYIPLYFLTPSCSLGQLWCCIQHPVVSCLDDRTVFDHVMLNASIIWTILEVLSHTFFHYWNFVQKANFSRIAGNSNASSMMSWVEGICKQSLLMLREKCARTNYHAYLDFWRLVSPTRIVPPSLEPPVQANLSSSNAQLFPHLWWHFSIHTAASSILLQETSKMHLLQYPTNSHLHNKFRSIP